MFSQPDSEEFAATSSIYIPEQLIGANNVSWSSKIAECAISSIDTSTEGCLVMNLCYRGSDSNDNLF